MLCTFRLEAQTSNATIYGKVVDKNGNAMDMVTVALRDYPYGTSSKRNGDYLLRIPSKREVFVVFSFLGFETQERSFNLEPEQLVEVNITMEEKSENIDEITVINKGQTTGNVTRIDPKLISSVTGVNSGSVEGFVKTLPGVASSNELSNQYSVRGGSFDENLVYVNDIEIYRPSLVRSGQQEGLSFINGDMVSGIEFSAGGFDAKFGDKMSSVLNITYNRPTEFKSELSASLLGASAQIEDISRNNKFTYNMGVRYKTFQYLYGTLSEKGEYRPRFFDYQGYFTYTPSDNWEIGALASISNNSYTFVPKSRETEFGTYNTSRQLTVYYEGQEVDKYNTGTAAISATYRPSNDFFIKFIASGYSTNESETFDILGYYNFNELGREAGSEEFGDSVSNLGTGMYLEHGRNFLDAQVMTFTHKGGLKFNNNFLQWGLTYKNEYVSDKTREWEYRDSAGYSLPFSASSVDIYSFSKTSYSHRESRFMGFIQDSYSAASSIGDLIISAGARFHYWTFNESLSISPRFSATMKWAANRDIESRLSVGWYHQPAFFRELKDLDGNVNNKIQTPYSIHFVAGTDYVFTAWNRPFKFTGEVYYKILHDLIPYQYENVRMRYLSNLISDGFATGVDLKINGEFVSGTQSWASMSIMGTYEDIANDGHGYIPRPSDQRVKFSIFFQDYLPMNPAYQMNLTGHIITGTPYGAPKTERYKHTGRLKTYRRVDIGLTRALVSNGVNKTNIKFLDKGVQECSISLDVFNMINIKNSSSMMWISDFEGTYYAVPDQLTGRLFSVRLNVSF